MAMSRNIVNYIRMAPAVQQNQENPKTNENKIQAETKAKLKPNTPFKT